MAERAIRFAVGDGKLRAASWKCWTSAGGKHDIYLACREVGSAFKASLHQSGEWHLAFFDKFLQKHLDVQWDRPGGRFIDQWLRPTVIAPGVTLAFRIVTPHSSVNVPISASASSKISWISRPPAGQAVEVDIIITSPDTLVSGWPGRRGMSTELAGSMPLDSGETVWAVHRAINMPDLGIFQGNPTFFDGLSREDISGPGLRALAFKKQEDGSRAIFDRVVESQEQRIGAPNPTARADC
jgi:hypothetical protein